VSLEAAEGFIAARLVGADWPLKGEQHLHRYLNTYRALYEHDHEALARIRSWDTRRQYRVDPLPELIADAWAHYLFGEEPTVRPANDTDAGLLDELLTVNSFASELERAAGLAVAEGEIWSRIFVDMTVAPHPLLDWVSRRNIIPLWIGPRLAAAAVVTELARPDSAPRSAVYRHLEVHAPGVVVNALLVGRADKLGDRRPLTDHPETAELDETWQHGLPGMLVKRIPNRVRGTRAIGRSDFHGILDYLLDLNEAAAIGAHNMRLTARQRAVISNSIAQAHAGINGGLPNQNVDEVDRSIPRARFDASEEVFVTDPLDSELGKAGDPLRILEYSFDAQALIEWKRDLVESALTRVGLAPQYVGTQSSDGYAISGTALRLRLIPTDATGRAKARYWDDALPGILATMAQLDGAPVDAGAFGRQWSDAVTEPVVERRPGLPADQVEEAQRHNTLVAGGLESVRTAVRALHPEWDDARVDEEVQLIREDRAAAAPTIPGIGF
jgi:hypothetical protein